jgi:hypothetical protein
MESIQHLVPQDSPLVALAQQGAEAVGHIVAAEPLAGNHRGEPGNQSEDQTKRAEVKKHLRLAATYVWLRVILIGG